MAEKERPKSLIDDDDDDEDEVCLQPRGILKNRKIEDTPCLRDSLLYGVSGGLTSGVLYFMFTSKCIRNLH